MSIKHFAATASADEVAAALAQDGAAIIDQLVTPEVDGQRRRRNCGRGSMRLDSVPTISRGGAPSAPAGWLGARKRCRELVMNPLILATTKKVLAHAMSFQLHLTQVIAIGPGEPAQPIHRDQWAFDFFPFPKGYEVQCNTLWAMTDFTEHNGATRVVPGSNHFEDKLQFREEDSVAGRDDQGLGAALHRRRLSWRRRESLRCDSRRHQHHLQCFVAAPGRESVSLGAARNREDPAGRFAAPDGICARRLCARLCR